jgi:uncharacterized protein YkwD
VLPAVAGLTQVRAAVVCLTNAERAAAGLPALDAEPRLEAAAQAYSQRMVLERFFAHVAPDGSALSGRLTDYAGWSTIGENLAWGEGALATPRATVAAWMDSPGHRANILSRTYTEVGVGVVAGTPEGSLRPSATYTANYGSREGGAVATTRSAPAHRPAARKPAVRCKRGTVHRVQRSKGRRVVRCVRAARR